MLKKKKAETGHYNEENQNEHSDSKDNTEILTNENDPEVKVTEDSAGSGTVDGQEAAAGPDSDKVIIEARAFEEKMAVLQDKYLRLSAEFDNYRKRTLKEKMDLSKYAGEDILTMILPIMDDFERALKAMAESVDCKSIREGIDLIYAKFSEFLKQQGVREIDAMNIPFNVDIHDAVAKIPVPEEENKGKVVDVVLKGYYLKDKIIRHSKVVVGE